MVKSKRETMKPGKLNCKKFIFNEKLKCVFPVRREYGRVKAVSFLPEYVFGFTRLRSFLCITTKLPKYCQRNHPKLQTLQIRVAV